MFTALVLAAGTLAAPVPKDVKPAGPPPRVVEFVPDPDGKVRVRVVRAERRKVKQKRAVQQPNGQIKPEEVEVEVPVSMTVTVELKEVRDLAIYTADGREADRPLALKQLADGGPVVVSADGQKVDPRYLRLFKADVLVLVSPELAAATAPAGGVPRPTAVQLAPRPGIQVLPAAPAPAVPKKQ